MFEATEEIKNKNKKGVEVENTYEPGHFSHSSAYRSLSTKNGQNSLGYPKYE